MALDDYKINNWTDPVINMPDRPGADGYGADDVKTWFDSNSNQLKNSLNGLITELEPHIEGNQSVFIAIYGTTTTAEINAAWTAGKSIFCVRPGVGYSYVLAKKVSNYAYFVSIHDAIGAIDFAQAVCVNDVWYESYNFADQVPASGSHYLVESGGVFSALALKAPLDSPALTGTPTAPTAADGTDTTQIATTAFVNSAIGNAAEIFYATYGSTTYAEITAAISAGKVPMCLYSSRVYILTRDKSPAEYRFFANDEGAVYEIVCTSSNVWSANVRYTQTLISASGLLKGDGNGNVTAAVSGTDYQAPLTAGTDYQTPLPSQTGNSGKFLSTNGTTMSWETAGGASLPDQTGNSGKFLTTDGTDASWAAVPVELFFAEYGITTYAEITAAISAGKVPVCYYDKKMYYFAKNNPPNPYTFYAQDIFSKFEITCASNDTWNSMSKTAQTKITASGILKGDGNGDVTAAVAGTDYQAPLTAGTDYQTPLPSQTGNNGKFLSTNGTSMSWETAGSALPSQTGNTGKFLTTDGTDASWAAVPSDSSKQAKITASGILKGDGDGGVSAAVSGTDYQTPLVAGTDYQIPLTAGTDYQTPLPSQTGNSGKFLTTDGTNLSWAAAGGADSTYECTYGTTTSAEIETALTAKKILYVIYSDRLYTFGYKGSATNHYFYAWQGETKYYIRCNNGTWTNSSAGMAKTASPSFTGSPTAPTQTAGDSSTKLATTEFVATAISNAIVAAIGEGY